MTPPNDSLEPSARSLRHQLVAGLLCSPLLVGIAFFVGPTIAGGTFLVLFGAVIALAWRRRVPAGPPGEREPADEPDENEPSADDHSSVWNAIPPWQCEGRHVEAGGITRSEQERALRDILRQAEELSEEPSEEPPQQ